MKYTGPCRWRFLILFFQCRGRVKLYHVLSNRIKLTADTLLLCHQHSYINSEEYINPKQIINALFCVDFSFCCINDNPVTFSLEHVVYRSRLFLSLRRDATLLCMRYIFMLFMRASDDGATA